MHEIKTTQLVKQYKNLTAVDKLGLEIQQGELFSLLGVNGAGKTTAIKMLSCLTKPTSGDAIVGGYSITKEPEQVKRLIGVSPQETAVASNLWLLGLLVLLVYTAVSYLRIRRTVATAVLVEDGVYQSEHIASPFLLGIFRPRIYLPSDLGDAARDSVVAHEQAHILRFDH